MKCRVAIGLALLVIVQAGCETNALPRSEFQGGSPRRLEASEPIPFFISDGSALPGHNVLDAELARIAENCGIRMLSVHGRTRAQAFGGRADWDFIGAVKDAVGIPLIANGDIETVDDAAEILRRSGADGVMIGRGVYGRPWFVYQVMRFLCTGERLPDPDLARRYEIVREHYLGMLELYGCERGVPIARKHLSWYSKGLPGGTDFRNRVNRCPDAGAVLDMMHEFYEPLIGRMAA